MESTPRRERPVLWGAIFSAAGAALVLGGILSTSHPVGGAAGLAVGVVIGTLLVAAFPGRTSGPRGLTGLTRGLAGLGAVIGLIAATVEGTAFVVALVGGLLATTGVSMLARGRSHRP